MGFSPVSFVLDPALDREEFSFFQARDLQIPLLEYVRAKSLARFLSLSLSLSRRFASSLVRFSLLLFLLDASTAFQADN
jgi:hypothetical protein